MQGKPITRWQAKENALPMLAALFALTLAFVLSSCGPSGVGETTSPAAPVGENTETRATIYPWPFAVPSVTLACRNPAGKRAGMVTAIAPDGQEYALNGFARSQYPDIDPLWLPDPEIEGLKINIGSAIDRGLDLCLDGGRATPPLKVFPGSPPPSSQPPSPAKPEDLPAIDESALRLTITSASEASRGVEGQIETNFPLPVEVMIGVSLRGQKDTDTYIGNSNRLTITSSPQTFSIPTTIDNKTLPAGEYEVEVNFYPLWGGKNGPPSARAITREFGSSRNITLKGSGESAASASRRNEAQRWLMTNVNIGDPWDPDLYERKLGPSERNAVTNRSSVAVAYYYPRSDVTIFMSTALDQVLVWRLGKHTAV